LETATTWNRRLSAITEVVRISSFKQLPNERSSQNSETANHNPLTVLGTGRRPFPMKSSFIPE
jgi:hypothetical protein